MELDSWSERKDDFVLLKVNGDDRLSTEHCLIYDLKDHTTWIIEDDEFAEQLMQRMKTAGVPIVFRDELPPGQNELEKKINEMLEAGIPHDEINAFIREYQRNRK